MHKYVYISRRIWQDHHICITISFSYTYLLLMRPRFRLFQSNFMDKCPPVFWIHLSFAFRQQTESVILLIPASCDTKWLNICVSVWTMFQAHLFLPTHLPLSLIHHHSIRTWEGRKKKTNDMSNDVVFIYPLVCIRLLNQPFWITELTLGDVEQYDTTVRQYIML